MPHLCPFHINCHCRVESKRGTIRSSEVLGNHLRVNPTNFLTELKRRNVYRAAVAYGVVAWFLTQLTTQVFPFFEIPNSAVRFVVIALAVGFPIAMLLCWLYELTPEGIIRTEDLASAIQIAWPLESIGEMQPQLQQALLSLSGTASQCFTWRFCLFNSRL